MSLTRRSIAVIGGLIVLLSQNRVFAQTLNAPGNLVAGAASSTQIELTWVDTNPNETDYSVWRKKGVSGAYGLVSNVKATSYGDSSLLPATEYFYMVRARQRIKNTIYLGPWSKEACATTQSANQTTAGVVLPLEVLGAAGTIRTAQVNVSSNLAPSVTQLWMQVHGLSYGNKASVQVNNSSWIALNNNTVQVADPGKSYGGIGGAFATLKMTLPLTAGTVVAGTNTVRFRFNGTDGLSMGFRVLAFNFLTSTGAATVDASNFIQDNPNNWKPPYGDSASIATGEQLWRTGSLIHSPIDGTRIQARCTDCHAQDGRDLKYFNYSNLSIIERSKYHGMTDLQGQLIASYIRTRPTVNPGRPWNPPYQPGPGLDSQPLSSWAAGAGLEWALNRDQDTLPYLFPNGIFKDAVASSGNLNVREVPIAMQLPDWNHWLPRIHPKDAWGDSFTSTEILKRYDGSGTNTTFTGIPLRQRFADQANISSYIANVDGANLDLNVWEYRRSLFVNPLVQGTNIAWSPAYSHAVYSVLQWQAIKTWEMMHEFNLQGYATTYFGSQAESRSWFTKLLYYVAPAALLIPDDQNGIGGSGLTNEYFTNSWYYLQFLLNSGNKVARGGNPIDWAYSFGRFKDLYGFSHYPDIMQATAFLVKGMQDWDNGQGLSDFYGWDPMKTPAWVLVHPQYMPMWSETPPATAAQVMSAILGAWFDKNQQYTQAQYATPQQFPTGYIPADPTHVPVSLGGSNEQIFGDRMFYSIPVFRTSGADGTLLNSLCNWMATLYPLGNWASLKQ